MASSGTTNLTALEHTAKTTDKSRLTCMLCAHVKGSNPPYQQVAVVYTLHLNKSKTWDL